jgi:aspartate/methionine/tyrosine aminotransferase
LHSLSKRSNLAGYRAAFAIGDIEIIRRLLEIRKHMGMMVPLPVQRAMAVALGDESHVQEQAERYRQRRKLLVGALQEIGYTVDHSESGLYIWCSHGDEDWNSVSWFADRGVIVTPGSFYGDSGKRHIRVALTATDENISEVAKRIRAS